MSFKRYDGPIYLPPQIFKVLSQDAMRVLKAYNTEAINRFHRRKVHSTDVFDFVPDSPNGGIDLPPGLFYQIHALSSRHPHPPRPGNPSKPPFRAHSQQSGPQKSFKSYDGPINLPPQNFKLLSQDAMKALKAYNTEASNRFHQRKVHNTEVVEIPQDDPPEPSVPDNGPSELPEKDLAIPDDPIPNL